MLKLVARSVLWAVVAWVLIKLSVWSWHLGLQHRPWNTTSRAVEWFNFNIGPILPHRALVADDGFFRCVNLPTVIHTTTSTGQDLPPDFWIVAALDFVTLSYPPMWYSPSYSVYSWKTGQWSGPPHLFWELVLNTPLPLLLILLFMSIVEINLARSNYKRPRFVAGLRRDVVLATIFLLPLPYFLARMRIAYSYLYSHGVGVSNYASETLTPLGVDTLTLNVLALILLSLYPLVFLHFRWRRYARTTEGDEALCQRCRYQLDKLPRCPECGTERGANPTGRLTRRRRQVLIAGYAAFPLILVAPFWLSWIDMGFAWLRSVI